MSIRFDFVVDIIKDRFTDFAKLAFCRVDESAFGGGFRNLACGLSRI